MSGVAKSIKSSISLLFALADRTLRLAIISDALSWATFCGVMSFKLLGNGMSLSRPAINWKSHFAWIRGGDGGMGGRVGVYCR